jgi:hypothetical protein
VAAVRPRAGQEGRWPQAVTPTSMRCSWLARFRHWVDATGRSCRSLQGESPSPDHKRKVTAAQWTANSLPPVNLQSYGAGSFLHVPQCGLGGRSTALRISQPAQHCGNQRNSIAVGAMPNHVKIDFGLRLYLPPIIVERHKQIRGKHIGLMLDLAVFAVPQGVEAHVTIWRSNSSNRIPASVPLEIGQAEVVYHPDLLGSPRRPVSVDYSPDFAVSKTMARKRPSLSRERRSFRTDSEFISILETEARASAILILARSMISRGCDRLNRG